MSAPVAVDPRAARAFGLAPAVQLRPGAVVQLEDGQQLRLQASGALHRVVQGGQPRGGIAEDAAARRAS